MDEAHLWAAIEQLSQRLAALEKIAGEDRIRKAVQDSWLRVGIFIGPALTALIVALILRML